MKRLTIILATSALLLALQQAHGQDIPAPAQQQQPQIVSLPTATEAVQQPALPSQTSQSNLPQGYTALVLDFEGIRTRMTLEQRNNRGAHWPNWMRSGLTDGGSLYWWLLAQWHHNEGNQDLAYRTLLTAWVLTRMEGSKCMNSNIPQAKALLAEHAVILNNGTTTNKAKQEAVLYSLAIGRQMLRDNVPLRGMVCNIEPARKALQLQHKTLEKWKEDAKLAAQSGRTPPQWKPPTNPGMIDYRRDTGRARNSNLDSQRTALRKVSDEFGGNQAWETADINTIINSVNIKESP